MVDVAVMLGAPEKAAQAQMEQALAFETKLAHVNTPRQINAASIHASDAAPSPRKLHFECSSRDPCVQILVPYENRTSESMYNRYSISRLHRHIPEVRRTPVERRQRPASLRY